MLQPCQNDATCFNRNRTAFAYTCLCPTGFVGGQCQFNRRLCQANTCWNNGKSKRERERKGRSNPSDYIIAGTCSETSNTTFACSCEIGWEDLHCQRQINYCTNITCLNNGVCRPSFRNYTCLCLKNTYSGEHCEITANQLIVLQIVSKSFAYVSIIVIISVAMFIVIMDVLKYGFGIDPVERSDRRKRRKKHKKCRKERKKPPIAIRFVYINAPSSPPETETNL